jgi:hypothetical protein
MSRRKKNLYELAWSLEKPAQFLDILIDSRACDATRKRDDTKAL